MGIKYNILYIYIAYVICESKHELCPYVPMSISHPPLTTRVFAMSYTI